MNKLLRLLLRDFQFNQNIIKIHTDQLLFIFYKQLFLSY